MPEVWEMWAHLRSTPMRALSLAESSSSAERLGLLVLAASRAASFTRLLSSAPLKPGVWRARTAALTVLSLGLSCIPRTIDYCVFFVDNNNNDDNNDNNNNVDNKNVNSKNVD